MSGDRGGRGRLAGGRPFPPERNARQQSAGSSRPDTRWTMIRALIRARSTRERGVTWPETASESAYGSPRKRFGEDPATRDTGPERHRHGQPRRRRAPTAITITTMIATRTAVSLPVIGQSTSRIEIDCAPSHRQRRPISRSRSSQPSSAITVAKWLAASCPTLDAVVQPPYGTKISHSLIPPG